AAFTGSSAGSTVATMNVDGAADFIYGTSATVGTLNISGALTQHYGATLTVTGPTSGSGTRTNETTLPSSDCDVPLNDPAAPSMPITDADLTYDGGSYRVHANSRTGTVLRTLSGSNTFSIWGNSPG